MFCDGHNNKVKGILNLQHERLTQQRFTANLDSINQQDLNMNAICKRTIARFNLSDALIRQHWGLSDCPMCLCPVNKNA